MVSKFYWRCLWFEIQYNNNHGASLYSLSVAWVSICEVLAPKRVLHCSLALFCLLPSYFKASENLVNKGVQRSLCYFTHPFRV